MTGAFVNGVKLNHVRMDSGANDTREHLVMVHGLATSLAFWYLRFAIEFSQQFRVTLYDLRGHGRSEMPASGYTPAILARDLAKLLDHLEIDKAHLLSHSFGGVVALNFAVDQPDRVRSLVLADTHISAVRHVETPQEWAYGQEIQPLLDRHGFGIDAHDPYFGYKLLTRMAERQRDGEQLPEELSELAGPLLGKSGKRTAAKWLELMYGTTAERELMGDDGLTLDALRALRFPILAMYGDRSQARLTGSELLDIWPHAEFRRVRDAGHFFPTSRPEEVIAGCRRFWGGEYSRMPHHRVGESHQRHFRSERVFAIDGRWYFTTREEARVGPFSAREEAHLEYSRQVAASQAAT